MNKNKILLTIVSFIFVCLAFLTGCGHKHEFSTELTYDEHQHFYKCSCGDTKDADWHEEGSEYFQDNDNHWKKCTGCEYIMASQAHVYNQKVVHADYLVTPATQTTKAVYKKSCVCGKAGTDTFEQDKITPMIVFIDKIYDGQPYSVEEGLRNNSDGNLTYTWYKDGVALSEAPTVVGDYEMSVTLTETERYAAFTGTKTVKITPRKIEQIGTNKNYWQKVFDGSDYKVLEITEEQGRLSNESLYLIIKYWDVDHSSVKEYYLSSSNNPEIKVVNSNYKLANTPTFLSERMIQPLNLELPTVISKTYDGTDEFEIIYDSSHGIIEGKKLKVIVTIKDPDDLENKIINASIHEYSDEHRYVSAKKVYLIDATTHEELNNIMDDAYNLVDPYGETSVVVNRKLLTLSSNITVHRDNPVDQHYGYIDLSRWGYVDDSCTIKFKVNGYNGSGTIPDGTTIKNATFSNITYTNENYIIDKNAVYTVTYEW
ncbi:MAG: hypothetical protein E7359_01920 [Clostridiales bacterium]|nr:hypothetical protein [Clostridiales bacterium]